MFNSIPKRWTYLLDREESGTLTDKERVELEQLQHKLDEAEMQMLAPTLQAMDAQIGQLRDIESSVTAEQEKLKKELFQIREAFGQLMGENQKLRERRDNLLRERNWITRFQQTNVRSQTHNL